MIRSKKRCDPGELLGRVPPERVVEFDPSSRQDEVHARSIAADLGEPTCFRSVRAHVTTLTDIRARLREGDAARLRGGSGREDVVDQKDASAHGPCRETPGDVRPARAERDVGLARPVAAPNQESRERRAEPSRSHTGDQLAVIEAMHRRARSTGYRRDGRTLVGELNGERHVGEKGSDAASDLTAAAPLQRQREAASRFREGDEAAGAREAGECCADALAGTPWCTTATAERLREHRDAVAARRAEVGVGVDATSDAARGRDEIEQGSHVRTVNRGADVEQRG